MWLPLFSTFFGPAALSLLRGWIKPNNETVHLPTLDHQGAVEHTHRLPAAAGWEKPGRNFRGRGNSQGILGSETSSENPAPSPTMGKLSLTSNQPASILHRNCPTLTVSSSFCSGPLLLFPWHEEPREVMQLPRRHTAVKLVKHLIFHGGILTPRTFLIALQGRIWFSPGKQVSRPHFTLTSQSGSPGGEKGLAWDLHV